MASMMKAPASARDKPPAQAAAGATACATAPARRTRPKPPGSAAALQMADPLGQSQIASNPVKRTARTAKQLEENPPRGNSYPSSCISNDANDRRSSMHGMDTAILSASAQGNRGQPVSPSRDQSLTGLTGCASPAGSPSPVRQLASQLERTALEDAASPMQRDALQGSADAVPLRTPRQPLAAASSARRSHREASGDGKIEQDRERISARGPVLLVLGQEVQTMPWESLPGLQMQR